MTGPPASAAGGRGLREPTVDAGPEAFPLRALAPWEERFPGLAAGLTVRGTGPGGEPADFGLTTAPTPWALHRRLEALATQLGFPGVAVARQVHGAAVVCLDPTPEGGVRVPGEADGLMTGGEGLLLVVTAADCVPVWLLDPASGGLGLLHAGWRGIAAGVLRAGVRAMGARFGTDPGELLAHLGPAVCGDCYEVGAEVLRALGREADGGKSRVDLRAELASRAGELGLAADRVTRSDWCTRCAADQFHSHRGRGQDAGRMAAFVGWRRRPAEGSATG